MQLFTSSAIRIARKRTTVSNKTLYSSTTYIHSYYIVKKTRITTVVFIQLIQNPSISC